MLLLTSVRVPLISILLNVEMPDVAFTLPARLPVTLPVTFPVKFPEKPLVAVTTPEATTLVNEILLSRLTVTAFPEAEEVRLVLL